MKKFLLFILTSCLYLSVSAQKVYFIYFESDTHPFYLKMGDKVYSSAAPGYLLLSGLKDSSYTFFIGFPSGTTKETKFKISIQGADRGFAVKNREGSLHLFDLQNFNLIQPVQDLAATNIRYETRSDHFTSLLAKAAGDSTLLLEPIITKAEVQPSEDKKEKVVTNNGETKSVVIEPTSKIENIKSKSEEDKASTDLAVSRPDTINLKAASAGQKTGQTGPPLANAREEKQENRDQLRSVTEIANNTTTNATDAPPVEEYRKTLVKRYSESSTSEGFGLVFIDSDGELTDTIRLIIPNPRMVIRDRDTTQDDKMFLEVKDVKEDLAQQSPPVNQAVASIQSLKSQCPKLATDNDFFKLRKNMAIRETDEAMVEEAKRYFKNKCFTTEQIKNLGALFLTSAGKYQFFDAAFLHVSDQEHFASLQSEIKDDYYLRRFKALIGE